MLRIWSRHWGENKLWVILPAVFIHIVENLLLIRYEHAVVVIAQEWNVADQQSDIRTVIVVNMLV